MRRFLQFVGLVVLVLWAAGGAAAWLLVKQRVQITVAAAAENADSRPDPTALLRDDVASLRADLTGLTRMLGERFAALGKELERDPDPQLSSLRAEVATLSAAVAKLAERPDPSALIASLRAEAGARRDVIDGPASRSAPAESRPVRAESQPARLESLPVVAAASQPAAASMPRKRSFLAFELPADAFAFDQLQKFVILPALSRVGFDGKSTLHDFTGVTSRVAGELRATLAAPDRDAYALITVEAKGLDTGLGGRNTAMFEHLDTDHHAHISFELTAFKAGAVDATARTVQGDARGRMTIRGVTRELTMPVKLSLDEGQRLRIEGEARLKLTDFQVPVPSQLGVIGMQDEVKVWIALRARCVDRVGR